MAKELDLSSKGYISGIETAGMEPSLELALKIQAWSDGAVRAADLRPDLADLIAEAARAPAAHAHEGASA